MLNFLINSDGRANIERDTPPLPVELNVKSQRTGVVFAYFYICIAGK